MNELQQNAKVTCCLTALHSVGSSKSPNAAPQIPPGTLWHCVAMVMRPDSVAVSAAAMLTPATRTSTMHDNNHVH